MYPIELHAVSFMSNHWHALATVADAEALSRFVQFVHASVARLVHRIRGSDGKIFDKADYTVVGPSAEEARLEYVLAQGVKEGLVRRCAEWPGVTSVRSLLLEEQCIGRWTDRRRQSELRRQRQREPLRGEVEMVYVIDFAPLPSWRQLDAGERRVRIKRIVDGIEARARAEYKTVTGVAAVLAMDPRAKAKDLERRYPAPIHAVDHFERLAHGSRAAQFGAMYYDARENLRRGRLAILPGDCFTPIPPFNAARTLLWPLRPHATSRPPSPSVHAG